MSSATNRFDSGMNCKNMWAPVYHYLKFYNKLNITINQSKISTILVHLNEDYTNHIIFNKKNISVALKQFRWSIMNSNTIMQKKKKWGKTYLGQNIHKFPLTCSTNTRYQCTVYCTDQSDISPHSTSLHTALVTDVCVMKHEHLSNRTWDRQILS